MRLGKKEENCKRKTEMEKRREGEKKNRSKKRIKKENLNYVLNYTSRCFKKVFPVISDAYVLLPIGL